MKNTSKMYDDAISLEKQKNCLRVKVRKEVLNKHNDEEKRKE